jgi:hypothetical protein
LKATSLLMRYQNGRLGPATIIKKTYSLNGTAQGSQIWPLLKIDFCANHLNPTESHCFSWSILEHYLLGNFVQNLWHQNLNWVSFWLKNPIFVLKNLVTLICQSKIFMEKLSQYNLVWEVQYIKQWKLYDIYTSGLVSV